MSLSFNDWLQTTYRPESGGLAGYGNFGQINSNASGLTQGKMQMAYNRGPGGEITGQFLRDNRVGNNIYQSDDNYAGLPQANYQFGDTNVLGGVGGQPYMRSRDGAFLGYGDLAGLNSDQRLNNEYSQYIAQDPALEAQRIQNQQAEQDLFEQQQAARAAQLVMLVHRNLQESRQTLAGSVEQCQDSQHHRDNNRDYLQGRYIVAHKVEQDY